mmetsp:Transcript_25547/g.53080  ORF Transcript_25547/g.53080 Transcript_25547/m.53080 type:complete len:126 (+) Transcript_25547:315-692(+)
MRELSNVVHGLGVLGVRSDAVIRYVEAEAERIVAEGEAQHIANITYALAKLGEKNATRWFEAMEKERVVQKLVQKGSPQSISNAIWAMAKMGAEAKNLASAVDTNEVAETLVREGDPQNIRVRVM